MLLRSNVDFRRTVAVLFFASLSAVLSISAASSQSAIESLFSPFNRPANQEPLPLSSSYAPPPALVLPQKQPADRPSTETGLYGTYCVRLCDGRFFPLQRNNAMTAAEQCRAFCPAAKTKIFSGNTINSSVAPDGARYTDLPTALLYRTKIVDNCTCNGRDAFGIARIDVTTDATLRPGDIVATNSGFAAYTGGRTRSATSFTPVEQYSGLPVETRRKLSQTKVLLSHRPASQIPAAIAIDEKIEKLSARTDRRAQLSR